jgi:hypothetical protein
MAALHEFVISAMGTSVAQQNRKAGEANGVLKLRIKKEGSRVPRSMARRSA